MPNHEKVRLPSLFKPFGAERRRSRGRRRTDIPRTRHEQKLALSMTVATLAIVLFSMHGSRTFNAGLHVASISLLIAGASTLSGALLGFLFGIPRSREDGDEEGDERDPRLVRRYRANTNLEQISDWLTKILVGVGLTQIERIGNALSRLGDVLGRGLNRGEAGEVFAVTVVLFYLIAGFLYGYLWSRLNLLGALVVADLNASLREATLEAAKHASREVEQTLGRKDRHDAHALAVVGQHLEPEVGAPPITQEELYNAVREASPVVRLQIFYMARKIRTLHWRSEQTRDRVARTIPVFRALIEADGGRRFHRNFGQLGYALKDQPEPDWVGADEALTSAIEIRDRTNDEGYPYYEFSRAIVRIHLDHKFPAGIAAEPEVRASIEKDLRKAALHPEGRVAIRADPTVNEWLRLNGLSVVEMCGPDNSDTLVGQGQTG